MPGALRSDRSQAWRAVRGLVAAVAVVTALVAGAAASGAATAVGRQPATPVVPVPGTPDSTFTGHPATAHPIRGVRHTPQNPYLAPNGDSGIHNDGWQTNTYRRPGPLGRGTSTVSSAVGGECGSITFDHAGRIVSTCIGERTGLYLIDPNTLATLGFYALPGRDVAVDQVTPQPFQRFQRRRLLLSRRSRPCRRRHARRTRERDRRELQRDRLRAAPRLQRLRRTAQRRDHELGPARQHRPALVRRQDRRRGRHDRAADRSDPRRTTRQRQRRRDRELLRRRRAS